MIEKKNTKEILVESFKEISRSKPANKITVREITKNCNYSTATFYREFRDKYHLISWDYAREVERVMRQVSLSGYPWSWSLLEGARYYHGHKDYLVNLLMHTSGQDSFACCLMSTNYRALKDCIDRLSGSSAQNLDTDLYVRLYCAGTVHLCCEWLTGKFTADAEDMADVWENALPSPLQPYLYT